MVRFLQIAVVSALVVLGASFGWLRSHDGTIGTAAAQGGTAPGSDAKPIEEPQEPKAIPKKKKAAAKKPAAKKKAAPKGADPTASPQ